MLTHPSASKEEGGYGPGIVHEAELITLRSVFAMVCTTEELLELLKENQESIGVA